MKFSLIVCTYNRSKALIKLLRSMEGGLYYPDEILIIDGSPGPETQKILLSLNFPNLKYYQVGEDERGLTKQRNFGIKKVSSSSKIVCFLDDDIVLTPSYFENLIKTYEVFPEAVGVGGYIIDEVKWEKKGKPRPGYPKFVYDGWSRNLGSRNVLRKKLHLLSDKPPGYMPEEGNGFSTGFLPPSGKIYPVEFFMGGVASYRKELFKKISFSTYFEGYGLYEDMDFCLRASKIGKLYVNTKAQLFHYHEPGGRPNKFKYGKMVVRNGWYVWRVKYKNPTLRARFKWHSIALVLTFVRLLNTFTTNQKKEAFTESLGRIAGWWSLIWDRPRVQR